MDGQTTQIPQQPTQVPSNNSSTSSMKFPILVLVFVIIATALGYGGYYYGHKDVTNKEKQVNSLNTQNQTLTTQLQAANKKLASTPSTTASSTILNQNLIKIPTLGVQVYVPDSIKDLTITPVASPGFYNGQPVTSVTVATTTISNDIAQCKNNAFGTLTKYTGQYPASGVNLTVWHEQFSGYYLALSPGEASCAPSTTSQVNQDLLQAQSAVFQASLPSVTPS